MRGGIVGGMCAADIPARLEGEELEFDKLPSGPRLERSCLCSNFSAGRLGCSRIGRSTPQADAVRERVSVLSSGAGGQGGVWLLKPASKLC